MAVAFFKKQYKVKRYCGNTIVDGYVSSGYADIEPVPLDIQEENGTSSMDETGKRGNKTIRAFGQFPFRFAEAPNIRGDLVFYKDKWYECTSCVERHNTLLRHFDSSFTLIPDGGNDNEF